MTQQQYPHPAPVDELAMLVRRLVQSLRKAAPDNDLADQALDYLKRYGMGGTLLRDVPTNVPLDVPAGMKPSKAPEAVGTSPSASAPENVPALRAALEDAKAAINSMKVEAETAAQGDEQMMLEACEQISNEGLAASRAIDAVLGTSSVHHIAEPAPAAVTVFDALREAEAALEVSIARILKNNPGHSISVTSEAKALLAVRAALAAAPAAAPAGWKLVPVQPTTEMCKAANDLSTNRNRWAAMLAAAPAAVQTHAEAAAALGINSALSRIRIGNAAGAIEPLKHALRVLTAPVPVARPEPAAAIREVMALVSDWCIKEHLSGQAQLDAHGSEATPVDEDRAKRCWIEEREAWQAIEDKLRALLAGVSAPAVQAVEQAPVLYVSKEQLDSHRDPQGSGSFGAGRYLPARITPAGNFTTPLFVAPQAPAADALDAALTQAALDVLAERQRQQQKEGYDAAHDDEHVNDEIAAMAALFIMPEAARDWDASSTGYGKTLADAMLPWNWAKPNLGDRRRQLVKGTAMALAELERIDRAAIAAQATQKGRAA